DIGTTMVLWGTIQTFGGEAGERADIFGNTDVDTFLFNETFLRTQVNVYGSNSVARPTASSNDGEDRFVVTQLQTMNTARPFVPATGPTFTRRDTLNLDGQADTDTYTVYTTGSQGAKRDYIINVLDSRPPTDAFDT